MTTNYVPLASVLYKLAGTLHEQDFNEDHLNDYILEGLRQLRIVSIFEAKIAEVTLKDHIAYLPKDLYSLTSIAYVHEDTNGCKLEPLRLATSHFFNPCATSVNSCSDCVNHYIVKPDMSVICSKKDGALKVSYQAYPVDEDGDIMIPDYEPLKEALMYYALYRISLMKYMLKEEGSESRVSYFRSMWALHSIKAASLNNPSLDQLENLKIINNRLTPSNEHKALFQHLNYDRHVRY